MFQKISEFLAEIFLTLKISEMTGIQLLILVLLSIAAIFLLIKILKIVWKVLKAICKGIYNLCSAKKACQKIQCPVCGRTLDRCVCTENQSRSYISRLVQYKKKYK